MSATNHETEAELENFRQKWREEVSAKAKGKAPSSAVPARAAQASSSRAPRGNPSEVPLHAHHRVLEEIDEVEPRVYRDLGEKQHGRRLDETSPPAARKEPITALDHYERAVEKESQGSLGDSVNLYRKAFRVRSHFQFAKGSSIANSSPARFIRP